MEAQNVKFGKLRTRRADVGALQLLIVFLLAFILTYYLFHWWKDGAKSPITPPTPMITQKLFKQTTKYNTKPRVLSHDVATVNLDDVRKALGTTQGADRVPHHVFFIKLTEVLGEPAQLSLVNAVGILAVHKQLKPRRIVICTNNDLAGLHFQWLQDQLPSTSLRIVKLPELTHVKGRRLQGLLQVSDALRLRLLIEFGGVFVDNDVIAIRPMPDLFTHAAVVGEISDTSVGNAIMFSEPNSRFMRLWWESYSSYTESRRQPYNYYSNSAPVVITRFFAHTVHKETQFYSPGWKQKSDLFKNTGFQWQDLYFIHVWFGPQPNNFESVKILDSTLGQVLRKTVYDSPELLGEPIKNYIICSSDSEHCAVSTDEQREKIKRGVPEADLIESYNQRRFGRNHRH